MDCQEQIEILLDVSHYNLKYEQEILVNLDPENLVLKIFSEYNTIKNLYPTIENLKVETGDSSFKSQLKGMTNTPARKMKIGLLKLRKNYYDTLKKLETQEIHPRLVDYLYKEKTSKQSLLDWIDTDLIDQTNKEIELVTEKIETYLENTGDIVHKSMVYYDCIPKRIKSFEKSLDKIHLFLSDEYFVETVKSQNEQLYGIRETLLYHFDHLKRTIDILKKGNKEVSLHDILTQQTNIKSQINDARYIYRMIQSSEKKLISIRCTIRDIHKEFHLINNKKNKIIKDSLDKMDNVEIVDRNEIEHACRICRDQTTKMTKMYNEYKVLEAEIQRRHEFEASMESKKNIFQKELEWWSERERCEQERFEMKYLNVDHCPPEWKNLFKKTKIKNESN